MLTLTLMLTGNEILTERTADAHSHVFWTTWEMILENLWRVVVLQKTTDDID